MLRMRDTGTTQDLPFMKMHGLGNDFVVIDSRGAEGVVTPKLARALGDRHRGVGFDQLAEISDSDKADVDLEFWNSDGTQAQACGNATRCVAQFLMDESGAEAITLRTPRGVLRAERGAQALVSVNMGLPQLDWREVPLAREVDPRALPLEGSPVAVGMGNPHCVFFVDDAERTDIEVLGPRYETDPLFIEATNVEFAEIRASDEIRMRVWERGTGVTLACGSGACATAVAANLRGLTGRKVRIEVDGGWLTIDWRDDGVWMTGPTTHVFDGALTRAFLETL